MELPAPHLGGGTVLMTALAQRKSVRAFASTPLSMQQLSELLWAADGVNRPEIHGRTAPSPHGLNVIDIYAALPEGVYRYEPVPHRLVPLSEQLYLSQLQMMVPTLKKV